MDRIGSPGLVCIGKETYASLSPIYDVHACFSASAFNAALGLTSEDGDVIVVGPAAYKGLAAKGSSLLWENMATAFPSPARPYAGITMINASIEGLANYVALHNPNLLTANRQQSAEGLKKISHSATEKNRLEVADKIIQLRSSKDRVTERELVQVIKDGLGTGGV